MLDVVVEGIAITDAFKRQPSGKRMSRPSACEDQTGPSCRRRGPSEGPAASQGSVIMHRSPNACCCTIIMDRRSSVNWAGACSVATATEHAPTSFVHCIFVEDARAAGGSTGQAVPPSPIAETGLPCRNCLGSLPSAAIAARTTNLPAGSHRAGRPAIHSFRGRTA